MIRGCSGCPRMSRLQRCRRRSGCPRPGAGCGRLRSVSTGLSFQWWSISSRETPLTGKTEGEETPDDHAEWEPEPGRDPPRGQDQRRGPLPNNVSGGEHGAGVGVVVAEETDFLLHAAHIGVGQVGAVEVVGKVCDDVSARVQIFTRVSPPG